MYENVKYAFPPFSGGGGPFLICMKSNLKIVKLV
jgi:hypothetical protein